MALAPRERRGEAEKGALFHATAMMGARFCYAGWRAKLNHETARIDLRSAVVLANTPPNSQLLSLFGDLFYAD